MRRFVYNFAPDYAPEGTRDVPWITVEAECPYCHGCGLVIVDVTMREVAMCTCVGLDMRPITWR